MKVFLKPLIKKDKIFYEFEDDIVIASYKGKTDIFNFRQFPDGEIELRDSEGHWLIETTLDYQPIRSARKENDLLYVELINSIDTSASEEERFPEWIDHKEYIPPKVGEANGTDEMEE